MNIEKFKTIKAEYQKEFEKKCSSLLVKYAIANNPVKKGDIVRDQEQIIKVHRIQYKETSIFSKYPGPSQCVYVGPLLTKDLVMDTGDEGRIHQENLIEIIKE